MADNKTRFAMEEVRELAFGAIVADYIGIGDSTKSPATQFIVQNLTNVTLMFSIDGITDNIPLPATGFWVNDVASNQQGVKGMRVESGTRFYVKRIGVPTSGSVYVSICYAK